MDRDKLKGSSSQSFIFPSDGSRRTWARSFFYFLQMQKIGVLTIRGIA
jgi:hypothetical protein